MITELIDRIFARHSDTNSREAVKHRLKLVLAYDRTELNPEDFEAMRQEIIEVVSRYVELDSEKLDLSLHNDARTTALIANLPIRRVKSKNSSVSSKQ